MFDIRFLGIAPKGAEAKITEPDKTKEIRWVTPHEALKLAGSNIPMVRLIEKWVAIAKPPIKNYSIVSEGLPR